MCASNVEDEIVKLGDGVSEIYFSAKHELARMQDSRSERFSRAARIEAFDIWRKASGSGALELLSGRWQAAHSLVKISAPSGAGADCRLEQAENSARPKKSRAQHRCRFERTVPRSPA